MRCTLYIRKHRCNEPVHSLSSRMLKEPPPAFSYRSEVQRTEQSFSDNRSNGTYLLASSLACGLAWDKARFGAPRLGEKSGLLSICDRVILARRKGHRTSHSQSFYLPFCLQPMLQVVPMSEAACFIEQEGPFSDSPMQVSFILFSIRGTMGRWFPVW
jgi:hypothetical protein